jgi:uncharacterized protein (DUF362 family)/Pyruvate/2-oxoacid:ferredoxin oxidoreductase delta subunit
LKPNLLSAHPPERHITTNPAVVRAVAALVIEAGGLPFIGDSPALDSFKRVSERTGMSDIAGELGIELIELTTPIPAAPQDNALFKKLEIAAQALEADAVINLPKLKTHSQMLFTLGVKNLFGTIVAQRKAEWHYMVGVNRDTFASLHLDIYLAIKPALTILDGIIGMEGHGPSNGNPRPVNLIAASEDAVALDVAVCDILNAPLNSFPLYRAAKERDIGETDLGSILFKGDPVESFTVKDFDSPALDSLRVMPGVFDWFSKRFLVSKPFCDRNTCIACGQCAELCPAGALQMKKQRITFNYEKCIRCYCCQEICPQDAIQFKTGLLVRLLNRMNR